MSCTSPTRELVTFWLAGSLSPAEAALVESHVAGCADCREAAIEGAALVRGLQALHLGADEVVAAAAGDLHSPHVLVCSRCRDEVALLRAVNADLALKKSRATWTREWWIGLGAAAAVIIAAAVLWQIARPTPGIQPPVTTVAVSTQPAPPIRTPSRRIAVEKASLVALANETLVLRGKPSQRRALLDDLAIALEPYQRDDFDDAVTRLRALLPRHLDAPEISYYLGVCLLMLDRPADAIAPLQEAAQGMTPSDEADYYLAMAQVNAARAPAESEAGLAELTRLCSGRTDVAARACAVVNQR
jgi:hypothetical protein